MKNDNTPTFTIALAGNPNCGKTAVFNLLTGSHQRVGNWPGVTVEKKSGVYTFDHNTIEVVDLPGVYSLSVQESAASIDECIACEYLIEQPVDCIVNIVDGAQLERNLYLTLQLLEMRIPMILVVNMMDIVASRGIALDLKKLQKILNCPVVAMSANRGEGLDQLRKKIDAMSKNPAPSNWQLPLPEKIEQAVLCLKQAIVEQADPHLMKRSDWLASALLSDDFYAKKQAGETLKKIATQYTSFEEDTDILIADARYDFISHLIEKIMTLKKTTRHTITQFIDRIVLNRWLGIPVFLFMMYCMFLFAINLGGAFQDFFDIASQTIFMSGVAHVFMQLHMTPWFIAIIANGIGKGINTTLTFIPVLGAMFFFMSFLEDSGYMSRAAFVMDRGMQALGLPGKSFVPMIVGLGCNVPAVMGARTLSNPRDRILTIMMMPFMSCSARLAIFSVFVAAFFKTGGQDIIFLLYITGITAAILTGLLLRKTILIGTSSPLIMELPPYHLPKFTTLCQQSWRRLKGFLWRAGRVIVPVCMLIGALNSISVDGKLIQKNTPQQKSILSIIGRTITPVLTPMGIEKNNWPATVGLVTGILAKEVVIGTLNTLYSQVGHLTQTADNHFYFWRGLRAAIMSIPNNFIQLKNAFANPLVASEPPADMNHAVYGVMAKYFHGKLGAFCYLLFILLYFPCIATMATMRRELNFRWALFSVCWSTGLAYVLAVSVYQVGNLFL